MSSFNETNDKRNGPCWIDIKAHLFQFFFRVSEEGKDQTCSLNFVSWQLTPRITPNNYTHNMVESRVAVNVAKLGTLTNKPCNGRRLTAMHPGTHALHCYSDLRKETAHQGKSNWNTALFWERGAWDMTHRKNSLRLKPAVQFNTYGFIYFFHSIFF